mmetsp:Transcript_9400/g.8299  ORF Transcript_9400/g.8299 Transcript_9400/m.8299 type:complete len:124 (+) Transcript_9400:262-633(+)
MTFEASSHKKKEHKKNKSLSTKDPLMFNRSVTGSLERQLQDSDLNSYYNSIEEESVHQKNSNGRNSQINQNHFYTEKLGINNFQTVTNNIIRKQREVLSKPRSDRSDKENFLKQRTLKLLKRR